MAWAPPTLKIRCTPATSADQHLRTLAPVPLGRGAEDDLLHSGHAATTADMMIVEGYAARPAGA